VLRTPNIDSSFKAALAAVLRQKWTKIPGILEFLADLCDNIESIMEILENNINELIEVLPQKLQERLKEHDTDNLIEIIMDFGRECEIRYADSFEILNDYIVEQDDLSHITKNISVFGDDNRAGIARTLHRISALRSRGGEIIGLTLRVGRFVSGTVDIIRDILAEGHSILILGAPGIGKTTKLREIARVMADEFQKRVIVVDTSNEIAGDGDIPHPAIGRARRMQVPRVSEQHNVMIEAVENHMPQVIIIDEIGNLEEALAARTIAERGVQLIATAHGTNLENLLSNPTLNDLIGGVHTVTLSDDEARFRGTQKTITERKMAPTFDVVIEMISKDELAVHLDVGVVVDRFLRGIKPSPEVRNIAFGGITRQPTLDLDIDEGFEEFYGATDNENALNKLPENRHIYIYPYGVARNKLDRALDELGVQAILAKRIEDADMVIAVKQQERRDSERLQLAAKNGVIVKIIRNNTYNQIFMSIAELFEGRTKNRDERAIVEAKDAIEYLLKTGKSVELAPQNSYMRMLQHQEAAKYGLDTVSIGREPNRRVQILPNE